MVVQQSQEYFSKIYKGNCIICVADMDPLWAQCPLKKGETSRLLLT
jgi:hypothetical protein